MAAAVIGGSLTSSSVNFIHDRNSRNRINNNLQSKSRISSLLPPLPPSYSSMFLRLFPRTEEWWFVWCFTYVFADFRHSKKKWKLWVKQQQWQQSTNRYQAVARHSKKESRRNFQSWLVFFFALYLGFKLELSWARLHADVQGLTSDGQSYVHHDMSW